MIFNHIFIISKETEHYKQIFCNSINIYNCRKISNQKIILQTGIKKGSVIFIGFDKEPFL